MTDAPLPTGFRFLPIANTAVGSDVDTLVIQVVLEFGVAVGVTVFAGPAHLSRTQSKQAQA